MADLPATNVRGEWWQSSSEDELTAEQFAAYDEVNNGPLPGLENYEDLEQISFARSFAQMLRQADRNPLRGVPITVIARGLPFELPPNLPGGLTTETVERAWKKSQKQLSRLTPRTRFRVAERSSHYVMFSQPGLIIREVERMVTKVRG